MPSGLKVLRASQIRIEQEPNENQATSLGLIKYVMPPPTVYFFIPFTPVLFFSVQFLRKKSSFVVERYLSFLEPVKFTMTSKGKRH